jgi:Mg-chelatase subunit ChlD
MNPESDDPRLTAFALGELQPDETAEVESRLSADPAALAEVEATRELAGLLSAALAREASSADQPSLVGVIEASSPEASSSATEPGTGEVLAADLPEVVTVPRSRFRGPWLVLGIAAVLAALAVLPRLLPSTQRSQVPMEVAQVESGARPDVLELPPAAAPPPLPAPSVVTGPSSLASDPAKDSLPKPLAPKVELSSPVPASIPGSATTPAPVPAPEFREKRQQSEMARSLDLSLASAATGLSSAASAHAAGGAAEPQAFTMQQGLMKRDGLALSPQGAVGAEESRGRGLVSGLSRGLRSRSVEGEAKSSLSSLSDSLASSVAVDRFTRETGGVDPVPEPALGRRYGLMPPSAEPPGSPPRFHGPELRTLPESLNPGYVEVRNAEFQSPLTQPLSTFGLDVDTGSYANVRRFLSAGMYPPPGAVRLEEMINYFSYAYPAPRGDEVFGVQTEVAACPWEPRHRLVRVAIKARELGGERPVGNLVFLIDVSGSMQPSERLPLIKQGLRALVKRLSPADRVAIVTYASSAGVRLESTSCESKDRILEAIDSLDAGGSTNGEGGIRRAYEEARRHLIPGGVNRVLLCTDGDFNVGISDQNELVRLIAEQARSGVFLTTLGVGTDNFKDALMRRLADNGNGSYHYLDSFEEAQRVLLEQRDATFVTVARDAKAQVEFNPGRVGAWRQIGYEKRLMAAQDFNDDTKDAGEIGAGQTVTVLYEIVPVGEVFPGGVDPLKYQPSEPKPALPKAAVESRELLTVKLRYQRPEGSKSVLREFAVEDRTGEVGGDFRFAAAVAAFGMALRDPQWDGGRGFDRALSLAQGSLGEDPGGWRAEFLTLVRKARGMPRR